MTVSRILALAAALLVAAACTPKDPPKPVQPKGDDGGDVDPCPPDCNLDENPPAPWDTLAWTYTEIDVGNPTLPAGIQNSMVRKPNGDIHVAYFKAQESLPECDIAAFGGGPGEVPRYELRVATLLNGAADDEWTIETISLDNLDAPGFATARYGIDTTLNGSGQMVIALAAGGVSLFQCGSTDVVTCTQGGSSWNCQAVVIDSTGCCPERFDAGGNWLCDEPCLEYCDAMQNACRTGSTVGAWAAIGTADNGTLGISYVDTHNAAVQDAQDNQGIEFTENGGAPVGIRPFSGHGKYAAVEYAGNIPIAAFTHFHRGGLTVLRKETSDGGGNDWVDPLESSRMDVWEGFEIGERIRLKKAPDGTFGLLFHLYKDSSDRIVNDLAYCTSDDDGVSWNFPCKKLTTGHIGLYPALAYDADSTPYIAYQSCGTAECPASQDGLRMAWYDATAAKWWRFIVHGEASSRSGLYNQIVVDPDTKEPTVAFQHLTRGSLVIARGRFE